MKLFKSLLVAPATLGLLAPMTASANEVTINDFNAAEEIAVTNSRVDGLEARFNNLEAGSFSETTTASFGTTFYVGSINEGADDGITTFTYDYSMDLSTSFTGEDSLAVSIIGGNASTTAVDAIMDGSMASISDTLDVDGEEVALEVGTPDYLALDGISYTFPLGGFTIIAGDGTGVDDLNTGACAYSAFTDTLSNCGTPSIGGAADSAVAASYDFGNGFTAAGGVGFGTEEVGVLTAEDESTVGLELAYTTDVYGVAVAYTDDDETGGDGSFYSINAAYTPDAPYSISAGYEFDDDDADSLFLGLTSEVGPGSLSLGASTQGLADDHEDNYMYELAYSYDVNDGMTVTPGVFMIEDADDNAFGMVVTTSFSF